MGIPDSHATSSQKCGSASADARASRITLRLAVKDQPFDAILSVPPQEHEGASDGFAVFPSVGSPEVTAPDGQQAVAATLVNHHDRRCTIEAQFGDTRNWPLGVGLSATCVNEPMRRDRRLLISALATALLSLLGAAGDCLGMNRLLKSNTRKTRRHSLPQGPHALRPYPERADKPAHAAPAGGA